MGALSAQRDCGSHGTLEALEAWLAVWPPEGCVAAATRIIERPRSAFPAEEAFLAGAIAHRRHEFRSGRVAAREALARLGCAPAAIPAHAERDPIWPDGFVGSIAHTGCFALALVARAGDFQAVGIDLEDAAALEPQLIASICRPDESAAAAGFAVPGIDYAKLCFVAKESLLKALLPRRRSALRFDQLRVQFDAARCRFRAWLHDATDDAFCAEIAGLGNFCRCGDLLAAAFVISERAEGQKDGVQL